MEEDNSCELAEVIYTLLFNPVRRRRRSEVTPNQRNTYTSGSLTALGWSRRLGRVEVPKQRAPNKHGSSPSRLTKPGLVREVLHSGGNGNQGSP